MNTYLVKFKTLDGNINFVEIYAENSGKAKVYFRQNYDYDEILNIKQLD